MMRAPAAAKINLALLVGPTRGDGKHEVLTVLQRIDLVDRIEIDSVDEKGAPELRVDGFKDDTLVRAALERFAAAAGVEPRWRVKIEKHIPLAAGLGGGSSDAATALRLANGSLAEPLPAAELHAIAAGIGADVPFFLADGPQLGSGDGSELALLDLPQDFWVVVLLPHGLAKTSTADVYSAFDARDGAHGWDERRQSLLDALGRVTDAADLAGLPPNDLANSPLANELRAAGAFRADVSGAGPAVYGLFLERREAEEAKRALRRFGDTWLAPPAWYG